jgi:hypothetical protein
MHGRGLALKVGCSRVVSQVCMSKGRETRELLTRIRASKPPSNGSVLRIAALSAGRNALAQSGQTFELT